jgi:O-antigen/teichoic acid export membrane protein
MRYDDPVSTGGGKRGALAFVSTFTQGASRLLWNVLIGRFGGPGLLGLTQSAMATASLAAVFLPTSAGSAASKYVAFYRGKGDIHAARAAAAFIGARTILATVVISCVALGALLLVQGAGLGTVFVSIAMIVGLSGQVFARGLHYGVGQVREQVTWDVSSSAVCTVLVFTLLAFGVRSLWVLMPLALANLLFAVLSWPRGRSVGLDRRTKREIDGFLFLGVIGTVASSGFLQSAVLAARATNGANYAGEFAAALSLVTPISLVAGTINLVLFPAMAAEHGRGVPHAVRNRTAISTRHLITIMVGFFIVIGLLGAPITSFVWGPAFKKADGILIFLLLAMILNAISMPAVSALTSKSNKGMAISAGSSLVGLILGVVTWVVLGSALPSYSIPIGYLVGAAVTAALPYSIIWRADRHHWTGQTALTVLALGLVVGVEVGLSYFSASLLIRVAVVGASLAVWALVRRRSVQGLVVLSLAVFSQPNKAGIVESDPT